MIKKKITQMQNQRRSYVACGLLWIKREKKTQSTTTTDKITGRNLDREKRAGLGGNQESQRRRRYS